MFNIDIDEKQRVLCICHLVVVVKHLGAIVNHNGVLKRIEVIRWQRKEEDNTAKWDEKEQRTKISKGK